MTSDEISTFLQAGLTLQVATIGADGSPHLAPMWYVMRDAEIWFRSFSKSQKIVNLERDPRITVLAEVGENYSELRGVMIRGTAELHTDPDVVLSMYRDLASRYPMINDERVVDIDDETLGTIFGRAATKNTAVRVVPQRITSWDHRKIGSGY